MSKIERLNSKRLAKVERFFEQKRDLYNDFNQFVKSFVDYKATTKKNNVWILDELTDEQKELFFKWYNGAISGGGIFYSSQYCNDQKYRTNYHFPREDDNINIVLIGK